MLSVLHLDADAFFASVEQAADARLRGQPVAVGGEKRGIIASASYEARKFGIYTPMPTVLARKLCPKLVLLPGDFEKYERFSRWMFSYAYDFTPDVEVASIDEGYFDLSGVRQPPVAVAHAIRDAIRQSLKLSVSEGIATNKLVSQVASKLNKPAAFLEVPAGREAGFLAPLANRWLPGVGPKLGARLDAAGLARVAQIAATPPDLLAVLVGSGALAMHRFARGLDDRPVVPAREPAKSFGHQETFAEDVTDEDYASAVLRRMADHLFATVRAEGKSIRTLTVKVRYNDMAEDQCGESLPEPTSVETEVYGRLRALLRQAWKRRVSLRLVSLRLSNLYDGRFNGELPLAPGDDRAEARRRLAAAVDVLREKYGRGAVRRGHDFKVERRTSNIERRTSNGEHSTFNAQRSTLNVQKTAAADLPFRDSGFGFVSDFGFRISDLSPVPLAVRSYYSFLNSTLAISDIIGLAKQYELPAIGLADLGNLHGAPEFVRQAQVAGIQPLVGAEVRVEGKPVVLYVENRQGYANLCRLLSEDTERRTSNTQRSTLNVQRNANEADSLSPLGERAGVRGKGDKSEIRNEERRTSNTEHSTSNAQRPMLNRQQLEALGDGLIAISRDTRLAPLFPGRFYRAIGSPEEADRCGTGLPLVVLLPAHYAAPADRWKFEVVQSIRTRTLLRQAHPDKLAVGDYHFLTPAELRAQFGKYPRALEAGREIAERCRGFAFPFGKPQFPAYPPPDGSPPHEFLRRLVLAGLKRRYPDRWEKLRTQIEEELGIIGAVGYEEYFLVVWDLLQECQKRGIDWLTRGSAADSLVCYCLGISDVCPIRFDLYFRRFLNCERMALNKLPDIDVDFPHDRKDDVVDLMFEKYGPEHCAVVGGFSTYQARGAVGDVAKVLGVSEQQIRRFTEHFPWGRAKNLRQTLCESQECRDLPLDEEPYRSALALAEFLDGFPRYPKMHPCGVVLSRQPMRELTPTFRANKGYPTTHYDMDAVEAMGLVKIDVLAQGGLAVMRDAKSEIRNSKSEIRGDEHRTSNIERRTSNTEDSTFNAQRSTLNAQSYLPSDAADLQFRDSEFGLLSDFGFRISDFPFSDPAVWDLIAGGGARAVHHIESPAMIGLCRQCNVREIDGLVAIVSVIRPGAANEQKKQKFTRRYQGLEPVAYPHPSLAPCLKSTFGLVVYEEHVLQICEAFAGLPPGRADVLRRALGKEKLEMVQEIGVEFFAAARRRDHAEEKIAEVWNLVTGFAGYAFCKAHSAAYAVEAYQSAWLKRYYPVEFMAAVLTNGKGFYDPLVYVLECHRLGIRMRPPWVNEPGPGYKSEIRNPKSEIRNASDADSLSPLGERAGVRGKDVLELAGTSNIEHRTSNTEHSTLNTQRSTLKVRGNAGDSLSPLGERVGVRGMGVSELERGRTSNIEHRTPNIERSTLDSPFRDSGFGTPSEFGIRISDFPSIRVPVTRIKGLTHATCLRLLAERQRGEFASLRDFYARVRPSPEEMELLIRAGALDGFGLTRVRQFWEAQLLRRAFGPDANGSQSWLLPPPGAERLGDAPLEEPTCRQRLEWESELLGFPASGHPLELFDHIAWETYCPVARLGEFCGQEVVTCGLVIEQRMFHQITGEPMKFLTLADWTGIVETELFAPTYRSYGLATVRYPVLEVTATVEPFENGRGFTLRVHRAGKPRERGGKGVE